MNTNNLAPIVLFVYNRPWHTEQVLNYLLLNDLSQESTIYIFSDGPKNDATEEQKQKIHEVRKVIRIKQWCKEVFINESENNKGLATSIIDGVTEVVNIHGKVIVLEDDLLTSKYFLKYLNNGLDYYQNKKSVFSICADRPPYKFLEIPKDYDYDVFVSLRPFSTGWATWNDRWSTINWSLDNLNDLMKNPELIKAFNRGGEDLTNMLVLQRDSKIDSWAIQFSFSHFINHAVAILPTISYVDNIGFDGTGVHSGYDETTYRKNILEAPDNPRFLDVLYEDKRIINAFYSAFYPKKRPLWKKIVNRISRITYGKNVFVIKKKVYC